MTLLLIANIIYPVLALTATALLANQLKSAFVVFFFVEIIMIYIGVETQQMGIIGMAIAYMFLNMYSYRSWSVLDASKRNVTKLVIDVKEQVAKSYVGDELTQVDEIHPEAVACNNTKIEYTLH